MSFDSDTCELLATKLYRPEHFWLGNNSTSAYIRIAKNKCLIYSKLIYTKYTCVYGIFSIPETIVVCGDKKSLPQIHCKTMPTFSLPLLERKDNSSHPSVGFANKPHTMLQQLHNLAIDDIIHGYQTCLLVEFFPKNRCLNRCLNGCNVSIAESQVEDCLRMNNFRYVDYQTLAYLSYRVSINASTLFTV